MNILSVKKIAYLLPAIILILGYGQSLWIGAFSYLLPTALTICIIGAIKLFGIKNQKNVWGIAEAILFYYSLAFAIIAGTLLLLSRMHIFIVLPLSQILLVLVFLLFASILGVVRFTIQEIGPDKAGAQKIYAAVIFLLSLCTILSLGTIANRMNYYLPFPTAEEVISNALNLAARTPGVTIEAEGEMSQYNTYLFGMFIDSEYDYRNYDLDPERRTINGIKISQCDSKGAFECMDRKVIMHGGKRRIYFRVDANCEEVSALAVNCNLKFVEIDNKPPVPEVQPVSKSAVAAKIYGKLKKITTFWEAKQVEFENAGYFGKIPKLLIGPTLQEDQLTQIVDLAETSIYMNILNEISFEEKEIGMNRLHGDFFSDGTDSLDEHISKLKKILNEPAIKREKASIPFRESDTMAPFRPFYPRELNELETIVESLNSGVKCTNFLNSVNPSSKEEEALKIAAQIKCRYRPHDNKLTAGTKLKSRLVNALRWLDRNRNHTEGITIPGISSIRQETILLPVSEIERLSNTELELVGFEDPTTIDFNYQEGRSIGELKIAQCNGICKITVKTE